MVAIFIVDFWKTLWKDPAQETRVIERQINQPNAGCDNDDKKEADILHLILQQIDGVIREAALL